MVRTRRDAANGLLFVLPCGLSNESAAGGSPNQSANGQRVLVAVAPRMQPTRIDKVLQEVVQASWRAHANIASASRKAQAQFQRPRRIARNRRRRKAMETPPMERLGQNATRTTERLGMETPPHSEVHK